MCLKMQKAQQKGTAEMFKSKMHWCESSLDTDSLRLCYTMALRFVGRITAKRGTHLRFLLLSMAPKLRIAVKLHKQNHGALAAQK